MKIVTQGFLDSLITDLHSKWRIQYGGQVNLINIYKPQPPYWTCHFEFFKSAGLHYQSLEEKKEVGYLAAKWVNSKNAANIHLPFPVKMDRNHSIPKPINGQWKANLVWQKSAKKKSTKSELPLKMAMLCIWWYWWGIAHYKLLQPDKRFHFDLYWQRLSKQSKQFSYKLLQPGFRFHFDI